MTGYTQYIHRSLNDVENSDPCACCKHRANCWKNVGKIIEAAIQGERDKDASLVSNAYVDNLSRKLCPEGKDSLIWLLLLSMYMMENPPMVTPNLG